MEGLKGRVIRCRLEKTLHDEFKEICKDKAINASGLLRQWIQAFVHDNRQAPK
mgnify:CR=1 FL=1